MELKDEPWICIGAYPRAPCPPPLPWQGAPAACASWCGGCHGPRTLVQKWGGRRVSAISGLCRGHMGRIDTQTLKQTVEDVKAGSVESFEAAGTIVAVVLGAAILWCVWVGAVSSQPRSR